MALKKPQVVTAIDDSEGALAPRLDVAEAS